MAKKFQFNCTLTSIKYLVIVVANIQLSFLVYHLKEADVITQI